MKRVLRFLVVQLSVISRGEIHRSLKQLKQIPKSRPSSDCRLQLACTKLELLVIADQNAAVNTFPGFVHTARQTMKVGKTRSQCPNRKEGAAEGRFDDWG